MLKKIRDFFFPPTEKTLTDLDKAKHAAMISLAFWSTCQENHGYVFRCEENKRFILMGENWDQNLDTSKIHIESCEK